MTEPDTKPQIPEDDCDAGTAQVKSEEGCKAENVDEDVEDDDEADKSFDPFEEMRRSRSRSHRIT